MNMKKTLVLSCVILYLLPAIPENQGSKLSDSLSCYYQHRTHIVCTWSESRKATEFVNMSLTIKNEDLICEHVDPAIMTPTHLNWTCHIPYNEVNFNIFQFMFVPDRPLESQLNVSTKGDEAKPQNLRCRHADGQITCAWEVRMEVTDSIDFSLYYHYEYEKRIECRPRCQQEIPMYLTCHCNITVGNNAKPDMLHNITVGPNDSSSRFRLCLNIKLQPRILTINESKQGEVFTVKWNKEPSELPEFRHYYELCYWRENDLKSNEVSSNCPGQIKELTPRDDQTVILQSGVQLEHNSNYSLKVRVRLQDNPKMEDSCYRGPWSEWSRVETLRTKAGPIQYLSQQYYTFGLTTMPKNSSWSPPEYILSATKLEGSAPNYILLYILIPVCVTILTIFTLYGCKVLVRYKKKWDEAIPNPNKSAIIEGFQKEKLKFKKNKSSLPYEDHLYVVPCSNVMMSAPQKSNHHKQDKEQISRPDSELFHTDVTRCLVLGNYADDEYPTTSTTDGYKPFAEVVSEEQTADMEYSQYTVSAFDGPYLFS